MALYDLIRIWEVKPTLAAEVVSCEFVDSLLARAKPFFDCR
jgi:hypothetical protein